MEVHLGLLFLNVLKSKHFTVRLAGQTREELCYSAKSFVAFWSSAPDSKCKLVQMNFLNKVIIKKKKRI